MEGGMSHVAARRGTKTQEIKVEKQNGNAATEPKLLHFVTFFFFFSLPLSIVSESEENCQTSTQLQFLLNLSVQ